ncbi:ent-copalyl diphosphate synthase 1 [Ricinus communis]|uniref:Ent-kaurene synthase A, chloroplast, putative n=1 Tax=Ricinus communis TaxID=3988 RepID=B9S414_RICCO|nr:ent-copalyl diphosphate synthase 1 [Ricinus communis]EEF41695.1 Ent-kaurene synthase A, chloroplast precursor, putative [Ricinus communis]|eukprot:XP_002520733.1 ent-copalyl diphosphate synthase, chloroplastic [Ricinus communis]
MSSQSLHFLSTASSFSTPNSRPLLSSGGGLFGVKDTRITFDVRPRCSALSNPPTQEYPDVFQRNGVAVIKRREVVEDAIEEQVTKISVSNEILKRVQNVKSMLDSMEDGEISISAYDTAWVALVEDINGSGAPQFPSSLQWIANNQLSDGSWGDGDIFTAHDRILNTLACVVALKSWNIHPDKCERGMKYFKENLCKLEDENAEHMPIGFEVAFPSLLELAKNLDIEVPEDSPVLKEIYASRNIKLTKIPKDIMHKVPTTLLHSLEGMPGLEWEKLLKLQCPDGSFLFSPSSTAFALMQTKNENCLAYLNKIVQRFNGGVPNVYPVDLFEHIWAVDRVQRLGISRYFRKELKECIDYVARYWEEDGICWARNSAVHDIDDTAMGFRLLRLYGHEVSSDVFKHFKKGDTFFCFAGQSTQAVTGMYNLYRASQVLFPGEKVLEEAKEYSSSFLKEKQEANEVLDKWIITKDLPGEVKYALDIPWYASLPRVESRFYLEQYGGEDDVWIGKTLYRMPYVNNNEYLDLAKLDYNNCQALHRKEWDNFQKWYEECELGNFGVSRRELLLAYFVAAASIFEPERSKERLAWAKTTTLLHTIESYFDASNSTYEQRTAFVHEFKNGVASIPHLNARKLEVKTNEELVRIAIGILNDVSLDTLLAHGKDISHDLRHAWEKWLLKWAEGGEIHQGTGELLVKTITLTAGGSTPDHHKYAQLFQLTDKLCYQLAHYRKNKVQGNKKSTTPEIESDMQQLVQLAIQNSSDEIDSEIKQTFFMVAKSFYYQAISDPGTLNYHIARVLFERVY